MDVKIIVEAIVQTVLARLYAPVDTIGVHAPNIVKTIIQTVSLPTIIRADARVSRLDAVAKIGA